MYPWASSSILQMGDKPQPKDRSQFNREGPTIISWFRRKETSKQIMGTETKTVWLFVENREGRDKGIIQRMLGRRLEVAVQFIKKTWDRRETHANLKIDCGFTGRHQLFLTTDRKYALFPRQETPLRGMNAAYRAKRQNCFWERLCRKVRQKLHKVISFELTLGAEGS